MIIAIDVDGVVANLHTPWLNRYNMEWQDSLRVSQITSWKVQNFVKPECGDKIVKYIENPEIYADVKPLIGSIRVVNQLRLMGHRVVFATACHYNVAGRKFVWLNDWGYCVDDKDYVELNDKSLLHADILIDDGLHNLKSFSGLGFLFSQPWNVSETFANRINSWNTFFEDTKWIGL